MTTIPATDGVPVTISRSSEEAGASAARAAAGAILAAIAASGRARVIFASAPSQEAMLRGLAGDARIDWSRVHGLHMDEYIGIDPADPRAFGAWLAERLPVDRFASFARIDPSGDAEAEARRYEAVVRAEPVDLTCLGFGVNGHIAFNEPGSDLDDTRFVRTVELAPASRQQQVTDGLFGRVDDVPGRAITLTVPALLSARTLVATVLGRQKAAAVSAALTGPISAACPASAIRRHLAATVHLDAAAASGID
ncbi:6-phosphogluconolactonase [Jiangella muralis]|uniref:6-phosphogluconolactonase n=1 Tax=Jiangella muralis TaxID=702383 RepID=UPI00069F884B|nr:6-phosphogluconolactonase [Jiangella muralis]